MTACEAINYVCSTVVPAISTGRVELRRTGYPTKYYYPVDPHSEVHFGQALIAAITEAETTPITDTDVHLVNGRFFIPVGTSLRSFAPTSANLKLVFDGNAAIIYDDPADAGKDYKFYRGCDRDITHFGAVGNNYYGSNLPMWQPDCYKAIQAANNTLPTAYDPETGSSFYTTSGDATNGRILRSGRILVPEGRFYCSQTIYLSATVVLEGQGLHSQLYLTPYSYDVPPADIQNPGDQEHWFIIFESIVGMFPNNLFGTQLKDITIAASLGYNRGSSGVLFQGEFGQGTRISNTWVSGFAIRGVVFPGGVIDFLEASDINRGPALTLGIQNMPAYGGSVTMLAIEHVNGTGIIDVGSGLGLPFPALKIIGGYWTINTVNGEMADLGAATQAQFFALIKDVDGLQVNDSRFGMISGYSSNLLFRIIGSSRNVSIQNMASFINGVTLSNMGTLLIDTSDKSRAGSGVAFTIPGSDLIASYSQYGETKPQAAIPNTADPTTNAILAALRTHKLILP